MRNKLKRLQYHFGVNNVLHYAFDFKKKVNTFTAVLKQSVIIKIQ